MGGRDWVWSGGWVLGNHSPLSRRTGSDGIIEPDFVFDSLLTLFSPILSVTLSVMMRRPIECSCYMYYFSFILIFSTLPLTAVYSHRPLFWAAAPIGDEDL